MNGEEFGHKLLAEIRASRNEAMKPLDAALCRILGLEERKPPQPAPIPQTKVPSEFPQVRTKYDKSGIAVERRVFQTFGELAQAFQNEPEKMFACWYPSPLPDATD